MSDPDDIEQAVLEEHEYDLVRLRHGTTAFTSVPRKARLCGLVLFSGGLLLPIILVLPESVVQENLNGTPASYPLGLAFMLVVSAIPAAVGGLGLSGVAYKFSTIEEMDRDTAWQLVGLEDIFTGLGFVTGGIGVLVTLLLAATGLFGPELVASMEASGVDPYYQSPVGWATATVGAVVAVTLGGIVFVAGILTERKWEPPITR